MNERTDEFESVGLSQMRRSCALERDNSVEKGGFIRFLLRGLLFLDSYSDWRKLVFLYLHVVLLRP